MLTDANRSFFEILAMLAATDNLNDYGMRCLYAEFSDLVWC